MERLPFALLTESERRTMLVEIATVALAVGSDLFPDTDLQDLDIGANRGDEPNDACPRERLAFLAAAWPRLAAALARLEAEPAPALIFGTREAPVERARRVTPKDLLAGIRRGYPLRVAERVALPSFDTPANRMVKATLAAFARDLRAAASLIAVSGVSDRAELEATTFRLLRSIRRALLRPPWRALPVVAQPALPVSLRAHGAYRLFWDTWRHYRRGFVFDWAHPLFTLPPRDAWLLYEYWCLFRVAAALRSIGCRATTSDAFTLSRSGLAFTLVKGRGGRLTFRTPSGERVGLLYNPYYPTLAAGDHRLGAASHAMRPDIALEVGDSLLFFDAKFRSYADTVPEDMDADNMPLVKDLNQMHAYRDGIRRGESRPVQSAWLLYIGRRAGADRTVIAYPANDPIRPFGAGEVGALLLRPGRNDSLLPAFLRSVLH